jgi:hypothetical protein
LRGAVRLVTYRPAQARSVNHSEELFIGVPGFAGRAQIEGPAVVPETVPVSVLVLIYGVAVIGGGLENRGEAVAPGFDDGNRLVDAMPRDGAPRQRVGDVLAALGEAGTDYTDGKGISPSSRARATAVS